MHDFYAEANFVLDRDWAAASFRALISDAAAGGVWLASLGDRPVGHAVLTVRYTMEHGGFSGYIDDLYVRPESRRSGAATALLGELFAECRSRGIRSMQVECGDDNAAALALYARFGLKRLSDGRILLSGAVRV